MRSCRCHRLNSEIDIDDGQDRCADDDQHDAHNHGLGRRLPDRHRAVAAGYALLGARRCNQRAIDNGLEQSAKQIVKANGGLGLLDILDHVDVEIGDKVDLGEILQDLGSAIDGLDRFLNSDDTQALTSTARTALQDFSNTMRSARTLVDNADSKLGPAMDNLGPAIDALKATLKKAEQTLALVESQLQSDSEIATELANTLREIERAGRSVRLLADYLEQHPEALLKGKRNE